MMSRKRLTFAVVVGLLACLGLAGTLAFAQGGGNYTAVQVQNLGDDVANVVIAYFSPDGTAVASATRGYVIPVGSSIFIMQSQNADLPDGFIGSAVLYSDQPITSIVNHSDYAGSSYAHSNAAHQGFSTGDTVVYVPLLFKQFSRGWNTKFYVQNVSDTAAEVTVHFYEDDGSLEHTNTSAVADPIQPNAHREYVQETDANITAPWRGSAKIESTEPVVVVVEEYLGHDMLLGYNAKSSADLSTDLMMPNLWKGYSAGWYSSISVMNAVADPLNNPATVEISYSDGCSYTIPVTTSVQIHQISEPESCLPHGWIGSARISSTNTLVGLVNTTRIQSNYISSYAAMPVSQASTLVELPLVWNNYSAGWYSSVAVQATSPTSVTITYKGGDPPLSSPIVSELWVDAMGLLLQSQAGLPNHWIGSATITADEPVVVIVNEQLVPALTTRDVLLTYQPFHIQP
ncbi:MAG TPA: hypothetical protein VMW58_13690 [Anaerolineae bacterium]|nr:hypothetical protein [Anaerolineae bacterium]